MVFAKYARAFGAQVKRYAPYVVARGAEAAGRYVQRKFSNRTNTKQRSGGNRGVTTTQHDTKSVYRFKRMPRKKRVRWRKFSKKVNAVIDKKLATRSVIRNQTGTDYIVGTSDNQRMVGIGAIYAMNGTNGTWDDIEALLTQYASGDTTPRMIRFKAAILDLTITNRIGTTGGAVSTTGSTQIELDLYHFATTAEGNYASPDAIIALAVAQTPTAGAMTQLLSSTRGATPFEFPLMGKNGIKIISKRKFIITGGQSITTQIRDPKNRILELNRALNWTGYQKRGWTQGYMVVYKCTAGTALTTGQENPVIQWGVTKIYHMNQLEASTMLDGVF